MVLKYLLSAIEFCGDISAKLDEFSVNEIVIDGFQDSNWNNIRTELFENAEKLTLAIQKSYYQCHEIAVLGTNHSGCENIVDLIQIHLNHLFKITVQAAGFVGPHESNANGRLLLGFLNVVRLVKSLLQTYMQIYTNPIIPEEQTSRHYYLQPAYKLSKLVEKLKSQRQHLNQPRAQNVFNRDVRKCAKIYISAMDIFVDIFLTLDRLNMPQKCPSPTNTLEPKSRALEIATTPNFKSIRSVYSFN
jgi:hypothetical protein